MNIEFDENEFDDIRPYRDHELKEVLKRFSQNDWLIAGIRTAKFPHCPPSFAKLANHFVKLQLKRILSSFRHIPEFQQKIIIRRVLTYIFRTTTDNVTYSCEEPLRKGVPYIYIGNHRDIALDSAILNFSLSKMGFSTTEIAIGDNLLVNDFVSDLIRINRCFIVKRNLPLREQARAALQLSRYFLYTTGKSDSIWIAQREGRAKDGDDRTNPSVVKMLYMAPKRAGMKFNDYINQCNIVPVAVSYEFDPCDLLKARELHRRATNTDYQKKQSEDLVSMYAGLKGYKGRVHVSFGRTLHGQFSDAQDVAAAVDREIHSVYKLWPSNYVAFDTSHEVRTNIGCYTEKDRDKFLSRFSKESDIIRSIVLKGYANAVINYNRLSESGKSA